MIRNWNKALRPKRWDDVVGQAHLVGTLQSMILADTYPAFSVLAGPTGVGKSVIGELIGKSILCTGEGEIPCNDCPSCNAFNNNRSVDVIKCDMPNLKSEDVDDLIHNIFKVETVGKKVYIIEEAHSHPEDSDQEKWLEPLTRQPDNVFIIFCTTQEFRLIPALRNRATTFRLETPSESECLDLVTRVAEKTGFKLPSAEILSYFVKSNKNSPRSIIAALENFASANLMDDKSIREHYRIQDANLQADILCHLLDGDKSLYDFIRRVSGKQEDGAEEESKGGLRASAVLQGLREFVLSVLLEISLGTPQGLAERDRQRIQELLKIDGDRKLKQITGFIGRLKEVDLFDEDAAMLALISLKLEILGMTSKKVMEQNSDLASQARMRSLAETQSRQNKTLLTQPGAVNAGPGILGTKEELLNHLKKL